MSEESKDKNNNAPSGCPGCNGVAVIPFLNEKKLSFGEVPMPRHAWHDMVPCNECGRSWIIKGERK